MITRNSPRILALLFASATLVACGGGGGGGSTTTTYTVSTAAATGGTLSPASQTVDENTTATLTLTPDAGYVLKGASGCGGTLSGETFTTAPVTADCTVSATFAATYSVSATASAGGAISPASSTVVDGETTSFTLTPDATYVVNTVTGCSGALSGNTYTTGPVTAACEVSATFKLATYTVTGEATPGGSIAVATSPVTHGETTTVTVTPANATYVIDSVSGCGATLTASTATDETWTTAAVTAPCTVTASFARAGGYEPLSLSYDIKQLNFAWEAVNGATYYRLMEDLDGPTGSTAGYVQAGADLTTTSTSYDVAVHLQDWPNTSYLVQACNAAGCTDSNAVDTFNAVDAYANAINAIGYVKASNTEALDLFGYSVAVSGDGNTMAVGAVGEDSDGSSQADNTAIDYAGAVYVFTHSASGWVQEAYLKASNVAAGDRFGESLALSDDGNTLAVGASGKFGGGAAYVFSRSSGSWSEKAYLQDANYASGSDFGSAIALSGDGNTLAVGMMFEDGNTTGVDGTNTGTLTDSGAVYVFVRSGESWNQEAYVKANNTGAGDNFGNSVALSDDGNTLAVGARGEESLAGAAYVFFRGSLGWLQQYYIKAPNTEANDYFGYSVSLSDDGNTLAVGAFLEYGGIPGICTIGEAACTLTMGDNTVTKAGAVYLFGRSNGVWSGQAYIKASNPGSVDYFHAVSLSGDGNVLAVGASREDSSATGVCAAGDTACDALQGDDAATTDAGAVYLFIKESGGWVQRSYIKAPNTGANDNFGAPALSDDGQTLAVGAYLEDSSATGICAAGETACIDAQVNNDAAVDAETGAVYLY